MIGLLESTQLLNIGIDLFSAILILVLFLDDRRIYERTYDMILFSAFEISYIAFSLSDMFTWMFDGMPSSAARGAVYFFNIVFMFMQCVCFGIWVLYVRYRLNHSLLSQRLKNFTAATLSILAVLLFLTPQYNIMFMIDAANQYHRTAMTMITSGIEIALIIYASFLSYVHALHEQVPERINSWMFLACFMFPFFVGAILQVFFKGFSFVIPFGAVAILAIDLLSKNHRILQDPLTGLNNRGSLQRYMAAVETDPRKQGIGTGLMMLDIDHFKSLNDSRGHAVGDQALIMFATTLKHTFALSDVFISRYGGDEFAVIRTHVEKEDMQVMKQALYASLNMFNSEHHAAFELHASVGIAWSDKEDLSMNDLLSEADHNLYLAKRNAQ